MLSRDLRGTRSVSPLVVTIALFAAAVGHAQVHQEPRDYYAGPFNQDALNKQYVEALKDLKAGDCTPALSKFTKILKHAANDPNMNFLKGMALRCKKDHREAVVQFKRAVRLDRSMYVAYKYLGLSHIALAENRKAKALLDRLDALRESCRIPCDPALDKERGALRAALAEVTHL